MGGAKGGFSFIFPPIQSQMLNDEIGRLAKERQQLASQLKEVGEFISDKLQLMYFYT